MDIYPCDCHDTNKFRRRSCSQNLNAQIQTTTRIPHLIPPHHESDVEIISRDQQLQTQRRGDIHVRHAGAVAVLEVVVEVLGEFFHHDATRRGEKRKGGQYVCTKGKRERG